MFKLAKHIPKYIIIWNFDCDFDEYYIWRKIFIKVMNAGSFLKNLSCQKLYIKNYGIGTLKTLMKVDERVSFYPQDYTKNFKPWDTFRFHWRECFVKVRVNSMIIISQVWILLRTNLLQEEKNN